MKPLKIVFIVMTILAFIITGFIIYEKSCSGSPECACRSALPGDPTCMSIEGLAAWCDKQLNQAELPQCQLD